MKIVETETIDRLFLELSQFTRARTKAETQFDQLIYAVAHKFPGESRFETALRYICEAENSSNNEEGEAKEELGEGGANGTF